MHYVPFWISSDYFIHALKANPYSINNFCKIQMENPKLNKDHSDLHIYPYVKAKPAILSLGCRNLCSFCPTSKIYNGNIYFGDPEFILPHYKNHNIHFLDENFFLNDMDLVLPLLQKYNIKWLAMSHFDDAMEIYDKYGEDYLYYCGLRVVEIGLENIVLLRKVKNEGIPNQKTEIFYLNMTFLPNETKESIQQTSDWMKTHNLRNPIYHYNGLWYAPGQFYYPYNTQEKDGIILSTKYARVVPTYIPNSFLEQDFEVKDLELVNRYAQFIYSEKHTFCLPPHKKYNIREFIDNSYVKAMWLVVGLRVGGLI